MRVPAMPCYRLLITVLVLCGLLVPSAALAAGADAGHPLALASDPQGLVLTGARDGSFAYYAFEYDGTDQTATIGLEVDPEDPAAFAQNLVGFRVYGPRAGTIYATGGAQRGLVPHIVADVRGLDKGRYLVQVFNYDTSGRPFEMAVIGYGPGFRALPDGDGAALGPKGGVPVAFAGRPTAKIGAGRR